MKGIILAMLCASCALTIQAQDGFRHLVIQGGPVSGNGWELSAGIDFASRYHSSFGLEFVYFRDGASYRDYLIGVHYKPAMLRVKNNTIKVRLGASAGTDSRRFIAASSIGIEWLLSLSGKLDFILSNGNGFYFFTDPTNRWRSGVRAGFRVSL